jgi:hypothetical protein
MTKVAEIIVGALGLLRVIDPNEAPEAEDAEGAIASLNRMMARWEANGYSVGWSPVSNPDDDMPTPVETDEAIMYNLAVRLRPFYGVAVDPDVFNEARRLKSDVLADVFSSSPMSMEPGLPGFRCRYNIRSDGYDR